MLGTAYEILADMKEKAESMGIEGEEKVQEMVLMENLF